VDDAELLRRFESRDLPRELWTHRAHVKVAFLYLREHPWEEAIARLRTGIQALNAANHVPEGPQEGYHETTTVAFARLIAATIAAYGAAFPTPTADAFCDTHPHLLNKHILRLFYSPQQRLHPEAKHRFIEPDLAPLPRILSDVEVLK
jgi:hypothetical protein